MVLQDQNLNLVLSTDAKPRLKWTSELHQRFIEAVNQLGGADKATPKSLMRVLGIPGLTLYHLKSHLQKYRLGKNQQSETSIDNSNRDYREASESSDGHFSRNVSEGADVQFNEGLPIAEALRVQMEVQRKLHEQIEVQRHLQLRIEAQGKYLQSVLKRAQETLAGYSSSSMGIEHAKTELSQLLSLVNTNCSSSSFSELTEVGASSLKDEEETRKQLRNTICSMDSSLTSSESSDTYNKFNTTCVELSLMDTHPETDEIRTRKRIKSTGIEDQPLAKRSATVDNEEKNSERLRNFGLMGAFDLNREYHNENESDSQEIDLNSRV